MMIKDTGANKKKKSNSGWHFVLHFFVLVVVLAILLFTTDNVTMIEAIEKNAANYVYMLFCIALIFVITYVYFVFENQSILSSGRNIALVFTILNLTIAINFLIGHHIHIYARPVALLAMLMFILIGRREAIFMNVIGALIMFIVDNFSGIQTATQNEFYSSLLIAFSAGMCAIFLSTKFKTRFKVVITGLIIVIPMNLIIAFLELSEFIRSNPEAGVLPVWDLMTMEMGYGAFGGIMSTVLFLAILPMFEIIFNCLTVYRLRELTSPDAKVLRKLKEEAPGTFSHSMTVAQLAEACATAIGEDSDYARAAAYYHDVGKLHYPEHFTENQGDYNLHDELTPELSADMIRSHARDGYALIRAHHLPAFLADVALQHHGTMPIRYFYAKALKMTDGELNIEDFSYMGPKPQSKLAAIIMICDASEAAVRAVNARSPEDAEKAIRAVIEERMDLEQFAECDITMADLTKIRLALVNALTGVYHHRIKYPSIKYRRTENGTKGENQ